MAAKAVDPDPRDRKTTPVWLAKAVVRTAKLVASRRGLSMGEFIEGLIADPLNREYRKELTAMGNEVKAGG